MPLTVDDALDMLMEDVDKISAAPWPPPKPPPKETPAKAFRRLADVPDRYWVSKRKVEALVRKKVSARVRLPRAKASMRIKFNLDLAPLAGIQAMCEEAGLELTQGRGGDVRGGEPWEGDLRPPAPLPPPHRKWWLGGSTTSTATSTATAPRRRAPRRPRSPAGSTTPTAGLGVRPPCAPLARARPGGDG